MTAGRDQGVEPRKMHRIPGTTPRDRWRVTRPIAILLVAFALRAVWLDRLPLWWDEGLSAYLAHQDPAAMLEEMKTSHHADPPGYPFALSLWQALAGSSPFSMRFLSACLGVASVALTWTAGSWLADRRAALWAALFIALAPMQVHYAREAKGYTLAACCALLSVYAWGRKLGYLRGDPGVQDRSPRWWIIYVLSTAAAVGIHYYLGLLVLWQGTWVVLDTGRALIRRAAPFHDTIVRPARWLLAASAAALLLAPTIAVLYASTLYGVEGVSAGRPLAPGAYAAWMIREFGAGPGEPTPLTPIVGCGLLALAAVGARAGSRRLFLSTWILVPSVVAYFLQTAYTFFAPRFLLYLGPAYYMLAGLGIETVRSLRFTTSRAAICRSLPALAAAVLVVAASVLWSPGLLDIYSRPIDEAEDPRPAIAHIQASAQPGDALLYVYIWQAGYLFSYYPDHDLALYQAYYTPQTVGPSLEAIFDSHPRLWSLTYLTPADETHNLPKYWLETQAYKLSGDWHGHHNLALYLAPDLQTAGVGPQEGMATLGGQILLRYPLTSARLSPGDVLALPLHWRALIPPGEDYQVFVHLGLPDTSPLVQRDGPPQNGQSPTSTWTPGQEVIDRRVLALPDTLSPGRYQLSAGLYRLADGARLPVDGSGGLDAVSLGSVEIVP